MSIQELIKELTMEKGRLENALAHHSLVIKDLSNHSFEDERGTFSKREQKKSLAPKHPQILLLEQKLKDVDRVLLK